MTHMAVMNRMGYRASILGNHEFDYGLKTLRDRVRQAKFPILSANVVLPFNDVGKTRVIQVKGIRFGIVGLTTEETPTTTHPKNMKDAGIRLRDIVSDYIKAKKIITPVLDGRIQIVN